MTNNQGLAVARPQLKQLATSALSFDGKTPRGTVHFHEGFKADGQPERAGDA